MSYLFQSPSCNRPWRFAYCGEGLPNSADTDFLKTDPGVSVSHQHRALVLKVPVTKGVF